MWSVKLLAMRFQIGFIYLTPIRAAHFVFLVIRIGVIVHLTTCFFPLKICSRKAISWVLHQTLDYFQNAFLNGGQFNWKCMEIQMLMLIFETRLMQESFHAHIVFNISHLFTKCYNSAFQYYSIWFDLIRFDSIW